MSAVLQVTDMTTPRGMVGACRRQIAVVHRRRRELETHPLMTCETAFEALQDRCELDNLLNRYRNIGFDLAGDAQNVWQNVDGHARAAGSLRG